MLWSDFEEGVSEDEQCAFVHGSQLYQWMSMRPDTMDRASADELLEGIQAIATEARRGEPPLRSPADSPPPAATS